MKGGLLNLFGICACSISSKNGDWAALHKGQLMASLDAYAALRCLHYSEETHILSAKSCDLSFDR